MALGYLICPTVQIQDINGKPIVGAKIYVYDANTSELANTYKDFENHLNTNPVLTDDLGNCTIIAEDTKVYNIVVNDNNDNLLFSKDNLTCGSSVTFMSVDAGYGIQISENNGTYTISVDTDLIATKDDLAEKQDKLYAGDNIEIDDENQINVVNRKTLYTQWPLKVDRGSSMVKLYLDQDFVGNNTEILPGADLIASYDEFGHKIIGVDTNSSATGNYNFYAGKSNTIYGDNNSVFGQSNNILRDNNIVAGENNNVSGYDNAIFGNNNTLANFGSYNFIDGQDNIINTGSCNIVAGSENETHGYQNIIAGYGNKTNGLTNCLVIGEQNNTINATVFDSLLYGENNNLSGNNYHNSIIGGDTNTISANNGMYDVFLLGDHNSIVSNNQLRSSIIQGDNNTIDKLDTSLIVGNYNNVSDEHVIVLGDGHNVSAEYNARLGKYSTNGDYWFAIGNGTDSAHRSNVFEVRKNGGSYYKYNGSLYQMKPPSTTRTTFDKTLTTTYTVQANDENITIPLTDAIAEYTTWHNTNRSNLTSPTYMFLELQTDTQVANAGMFYINMYYNGISTAEPILKGNVYIDKYWTGLSMAFCNGVIPSNTNLQNSYWWLEMRNSSTGSKWLANTVITVKIRFIGTAITYS